MEGATFIDDLFGDAHHPVRPAPTPAERAVFYRIHELQTFGCCSKVAWSNLGAIAYITPDQLSINVCSLAWQPREEKWTLGGDLCLYKIVIGAQLAHLSWSPSGAELAAIDVLGRVTIFSTLLAVNRFRQIYTSSDFDSGYYLAAVIGLHWLAPSHSHVRSPVATRDGEEWVFSQPKKSLPMGPVNGNNTTALFCVTRNGMIRISTQQRNGRFHDIALELDNVLSSGEILTHAAFANEKEDSLLLVVHDRTRQLRVYRIRTKWEPLSSTDQSHGVTKILTPSLEITCLAVIDDCSTFEREDGIVVELSNLTIIPRTPIAEPRVVTCFNFNDIHQSGAYASTTLAVWDILERPHSLHGSFDQLTSRRSSIQSAETSQPETYLRRREDLEVPGTILSVQRDIHQMPVLFHSDGSITYPPADSWDIGEPNQDGGCISSIQQAGFKFTAIEDGIISVALSPSNCMIVVLPAYGKPRLKMPDYVEKSPGPPSDDAGMIGLVLHFAYSCYNHINNDDVLALMESHIRPGLIPRLLEHIYRSVNVEVDFTEHQSGDQTVKSLGLQRCLSMQAHLGTTTENENLRRNVPAKVAWVAINLRMVAWVYRSAMVTAQQAATMGSEIPVTDAPRSILRMAKWTIDLMMLICDDLMTLLERFQERELDWTRLGQAVLESKSAALPVLLTSTTRVLLRFVCRNLRSIDCAAASYIETATSLEQRQGWIALRTWLNENPGLLRAFEHVCIDVSDRVRKAYEDAGTSAAKRSAMELRLLVSGQIPDIMVPVAQHLLGPTLERFQSEAEMSNVHFAYVDWLGLTEDRAADRWRRTHNLDMLRKMILCKRVKVRRCTRCASVTEDFAYNPHARIAQWVVLAQKTCYCGSQWMVE